MPALEVVVYPALLLSVYGIYRAGGRAPRHPGSVFEWVRALALAVFLGLAAGLQYRMILLGEVSGPSGLVAATFSVAAMVGLLGLHVVRMMDTPAAPPASESPAGAP